MTTTNATSPGSGVLLKARGGRSDGGGEVFLTGSSVTLGGRATAPKTTEAFECVSWPWRCASVEVSGNTPTGVRNYEGTQQYGERSNIVARCVGQRWC